MLPPFLPYLKPIKYGHLPGPLSPAARFSTDYTQHVVEIVLLWLVTHHRQTAGQRLGQVLGLQQTPPVGEYLGRQGGWHRDRIASTQPIRMWPSRSAGPRRCRRGCGRRCGGGGRGRRWCRRWGQNDVAAVLVQLIADPLLAEAALGVAVGNLSYDIVPTEGRDAAASAKKKTRGGRLHSYLRHHQHHQ